MNNGLINRLFKFDNDYEEYELLEKKWESESLDKTSEHSDTSGYRHSLDSGRSSIRVAHEIPLDLDSTEKKLKQIFSADINTDVILRRIGSQKNGSVLLVYVNGMADANTINEFIIKPLMKENRKNTPESLIKDVLLIGEAKTEKDMSSAVNDVIEGMTAVFLQGESCCIVLETRGFEKRAVGESKNETVVHGPKESFTECLRTNITLVRRIIHKPDLIVEIEPAGGENNTKLALVYLGGTVNKSLLANVKNELGKIKLKTVLSSGIIEQMIETKSMLPVPRTLSTERPDRACAHIMQGCICLLVEGSPLAVVLPVTLLSLMNSPEDVYLRRPLGSVLRVIRYFGATVSIILPGFFLSAALYHQGGLTAEVLSTVIASRKMVFEPIAVEMILLLLVFQLIREAGLRVPGAIGQAIGIIGGLIMGQAAVTANLASSVVLIIVALSGLGNFCIPDYSLQIASSYLRMALVVAAWAAGLVGLMASALLLTAMLASLKSFGVPFFSPYSPKTVSKRPFILRGRLGESLRDDDYLNTSEEI